MRIELKWRTLEVRRNMTRLGLMYGCVNRQTTELLSSSFESKKGSYSHGTRGTLKMYMRRANTEYYRRSFSFRNKLPEEVRTLKSFRAKLSVIM